jgi:plastocyanin
LNRGGPALRNKGMQRRIVTFIALAGLVVGLAACSSSAKSSPPAAAAGPAQITIDSSFTYHVTAVTAGSTVTVKNDSTSMHTVTQDGGGFNVTIDAGKTATFPAPAAGTYKFHCNIHSFMHGTLTVT